MVNSIQETWILHMLMNSIEKPVLTTSGSQLRISCANFRTVTFIIQRDRDAHDVYMSVVELSKPRDVRNLFCFSYKPNKGELRQDTGWNFHDFQAEFQRQVLRDICSSNLSIFFLPCSKFSNFATSIRSRLTIN